MRQKSGPEKAPAEPIVKDIRRAARRHVSAEEKIRVVLRAGVARRAWPSSAAARGSPRRCTMAGPRSSLRPARRGSRATRRVPQPPMRKDLRREAQALKEVVADLTRENRLLNKSMIGDGGDEA
jgi:transposase